MEFVFQNIVLTKRTDTMNLTVIGDIHEDAKACDVDGLNRLLEKRSKLPNSYFMLIGDMADWILHDDKRYMRGNRRDIKFVDKFGGDSPEDNYLPSEVARQAEKYRKYRWLMIGAGNHEMTILKKHHFSPAAMLAKELGVPYGGYSGILRLGLQEPTRAPNNPRHNIDILYHHGFGGGVISKGFAWARDYGRMFDFSAFVFGHSHHSVIHQEAHINCNRNGKFIERQKFFVNCGTWLRSFVQGGTPTYSELKGYPPVAMSSPLISISVTKDSYNLAVTAETI